MIEYLSAFLNAYLKENLLELGLTTGMVEWLVRGGLILLALLLAPEISGFCSLTAVRLTR